MTSHAIDASPAQTGCRIRIRGLVQGVGFRPYIFKLATSLSLSGSVRNDGEGVLVEAYGPPEQLSRFLAQIGVGAPPLSRIDSQDVESIRQEAAISGFEILSSADGEVATGVVPDAATCPQCLAEIRDPENRRFGYAFTNCTNCGPRLSIVRQIPYDRASTSMARFQMCPACEAEYHAPSDRRFHAEPNACPACGPRLWFEAEGRKDMAGDPLDLAADRLSRGDILAIKGIGGFQIAADASNSDTVERLRSRKNRPDKPLALMARDLDQIARYCRLSSDEKEMLQSPEAPIVLLQKRGEVLADGLAPGQNRLGVMLPNSPLHHLLLARLNCPIVLTSGNVSGDPQETDNEAARRRLGPLVDGFLMHDREVVNRLDDSVVRLDPSGPVVLRRARGYAPASIRLPSRFSKTPKVLAMGGELKSAFCLLSSEDAILSQHIGDLESAPAFADYKKMLRLYLDLYQFTPEIIAVDRHPQYLSTVLGKELALEFDAEIVDVQHHHAHFASCLAEQEPDFAGPVWGVVLDGLGWGGDGTIWGGEILKGGIGGFERIAHFESVALPGGATAVREPWRNLAAHLRAAFGPEYRAQLTGLQSSQIFADKRAKLLDRLMEQSVNTPMSSSAGRLFDAGAAALGLCVDRQSFEGQAAMALEAAAEPYRNQDMECYPVHVLGEGPLHISFAAMWPMVLDDLRMGRRAGEIAARFHNTVIEGLFQALQQAGIAAGDTAALSGGVFQNAILKEGLRDLLTANGIKVLCHNKVPANDGGLALGQAAIAAFKPGR